MYRRKTAGIYLASYSLGLRKNDVQSNILLLAKYMYAYTNSSSSLSNFCIYHLNNNPSWHRKTEPSSFVIDERYPQRVLVTLLL